MFGYDFAPRADLRLFVEEFFMAVLDESSLHTKLGLRRLGIVQVRETPLAELLHIGRADTPLEVLVKLHWHTCRVIDELPIDQVARTVVKYACNIPRDVELNRLGTVGERLAFVARKNSGSRGWAKSTHQQKLLGRVKRIWTTWQRGQNPPMPVGLLEEEVAAEEKHERFGSDGRMEVPSSILDALLLDTNKATVDGLGRLLPQMLLFFEVSPSGHMVTVRTDSCEQLPVFTSRELFEEYADSSRRRGRERGRYILDRLAGFPEVGLSLNPIAGSHRHLHWLAKDVERLRRDMGNEEE
ncbi:hypothetical protein ACFWNN_19905 [Lentzea sp. NPDC058450]|uniref:hypothetical protein n=1 Tax=Lentzea sp. NPDC058450 TaxID=3346505 RepID=UPI00364E51C7